MKHGDVWSRLSQRARLQPDPGKSSMPEGFDLRVLAAFRSNRPEIDPDVGLVSLLRQMVGAGAVVVVVSILMNFSIFAQPEEPHSFAEVDLVSAAYFGDQP